MQAQLLQRLHLRGLGQRRRGGPLPRVQPRLQPETRTGEELQARQHREALQRFERREGPRRAALRALQTGPPSAREESVFALQGALLPDAHPDTPPAAVRRAGTPVGRRGGAERLDLSQPRGVQAAAL